jgi:23S rRNA (cytosine1962-C5)-methyltransferase
MPTVSITQRGEERVRAGHLWVYRSDVVDAKASPGDTVVVTGARGRRIGQALFSDRSQITLRL